MGKLRNKLVKGESEGSYYLTPAKLLEHEVQSLQKMAMIPWPSNLSQWKEKFLTASSRAKNQSALDLHVSFQALDPRAKAGDRPYSVELGALISLRGSPIVTYFLALGGNSDAGSRHGLRKFHFDLDPVFQPSEPKPALHIQFPGRSCPALRKAGYDDSAFNGLLPKLDKPRLPSLPTCFALLAHWALLEYHITDDKIRTFISSREWLSVVASAERDILSPFLAHSANWLEQTKNTGKSLLSYFYGLPRS